MMTLKALRTVRILLRTAGAAAVIFTASHALARDVGGACTGTWAPADNPVVFLSTCTVPVGETLSILPGVIVSGQGHTLFVDGTLAADDATTTNLLLSFRPGSGGTINGSEVTGSGFFSTAIAITNASPSLVGNTVSAVGVAISVGGTSTVAAAQPVISGNTITASSRGVDVAGTARPMITGNTITTSGSGSVGLEYSGTPAGSATGNIIGFEAEAGSNRVGVQLLQGASPVIDGNTITDDATQTDTGIVLDVTGVSTAQVTDNDVCVTGSDTPIRLGPGPFADAALAQVSGNMFTCGLAAGFGLQGTIDEDSTLKSIEGLSNLRFSSTVVVAAGSRLAIPEGFAVDGTGHTLAVDGTLEVDDATITNLFVSFRAGSGGTISETELTVSSFFSTAIAITNASPSLVGNTVTAVGTAISVGGTSTVAAAQPVISGNTITASSRGVDMSGTARPTITGNTITTSGSSSVGLEYSGTSAGSAMGNIIGFEVEAGSSRVGVQLLQGASPVIDGNTITDDATQTDTGIVLDVTAASTARVTDNDICVTGGDTPIRLGPGPFADAALAQVSGNMFTCGLAAGFGVQGTIDADSTLKGFGGATSMRFSSTVVVSDGRRLAVPAGFTIEGDRNTLVVDGALDVEDATIADLFVSFRAGSGGTISGSDLTGSGFFGTSISIADASPSLVGNTLTAVGTAISVGGTSTVTRAQPVIDGNTIMASSRGVDVSGTARPTITGNTITTSGSGSVGIEYSGTAAGSATGNTIGFETEAGSNRAGVQLLQGASPVIDDNTITDDPTRTDTGIVLDVSAASTAQVTDNDICVTGGDTPIRLGPGVFADTALAQVSGNMFTCGLAAGFGLQGTVDTNSTLKSVEGISSLRLSSTVVVSDGRRLAVPAGFTIEGDRNTLVVDGTLDVEDATVTDLFVSFRAGSGGTISGSGLSGSNVFGTSISIADASPSLVGNTLTAVGTAISVGGTSTVTRAQPVIEGNTIAASSRGVDVSGTARPTITGNTITTSAGGSVGLEYSGTSAGSATGNTIGFEAESGSNRTGVHLQQGASPVIEANTITDDFTRTDTGIVLDVSAASTTQVTDNDICVTGGDTPIRLGPGVFADAALAQVSGNVFSCGLAAGVGLQGTIDADSTLKSFGGASSMRFSSTVVVSDGRRLAVPAGFTIDGDGHTLFVDGTLEADDATITNLFLNFRAGSDGTISETEMTGPAFGTAISVTNASPSFLDNTFTDMGTAIALIGTTDALIDGNVFDSNGVCVRVDGATSRSTVSNNIFARNTTSVSFDDATGLFSAFPRDLHTNLASGPPDENTVRLPTLFDQSGTVRATFAPYAVFGWNIQSGRVLIVEPGAVFQMSNFVDAVVDGELVATGTPERPIVFTSPSPKTGVRWRGLRINNKTATAQTELDACIVEFAGAGNGAALVLNNASIDIANTVVTGSANDGFDITNASRPTITGSTVIGNVGDGITTRSGARPRITGSSIFANGGNGVVNQDCAVVRDPIDAQRNYWGDDSGPRDASDDRANGGLFNPLGQGEEVGDCVDYDPWIRIGPSLAGTITAVSGGGQSAVVGSCLPQPVVVEVRSALDSPLQGVDVTFSVQRGAASIEETQPVVTGANGRAAATVCLGLSPGDVAIAATARDVDSPLASFAATGTGGAPLAFVAQATPLELRVRQQRSGQRGDVNGDGKVNNTDALLIEGVLGGYLAPDARPALRYTRAADINRDGRITRGDAVAIQGFIVGAVPQAAR